MDAKYLVQGRKKHVAQGFPYLKSTSSIDPPRSHLGIMEISVINTLDYYKKHLLINYDSCLPDSDCPGYPYSETEVTEQDPKS